MFKPTWCATVKGKYGMPTRLRSISTPQRDIYLLCFVVLLSYDREGLNTSTSTLGEQTCLFSPVTVTVTFGYPKPLHERGAAHANVPVTVTYP